LVRIIGGSIFSKMDEISGIGAILRRTRLGRGRKGDTCEGGKSHGKGKKTSLRTAKKAGGGGRIQCRERGKVKTTKKTELKVWKSLQIQLLPKKDRTRKKLPLLQRRKRKKFKLFVKTQWKWGVSSDTKTIKEREGRVIVGGTASGKGGLTPAK